jgi:hypothetical protein
MPLLLQEVSLEQSFDKMTTIRMTFATYGGHKLMHEFVSLFVAPTPWDSDKLLALAQKMFEVESETIPPIKIGLPNLPPTISINAALHIHGVVVNPGDTLNITDLKGNQHQYQVVA